MILRRLLQKLIPRSSHRLEDMELDSRDSQEGVIVDFYRGTRPDHRGRYIGQIRGWSRDDLETVHDYIQWLFPSRKKSPFNPNAPIFDQRQISIFRSDPTLQAELAESLKVMLALYGLELVDEDGRVSVSRGEKWDRRKRQWLTPQNHNFLRITRILHCLRTLGLGRHAKAFYGILADVYEAEGHDIIPPKTLAIRARAAGGTKAEG